MSSMQSPKKILTRIRIINWMYFSNETISLNGGSALISGANGAGKSTILDAVQMVLTGNTTHFNEAANEKSKRDLRICQVQGEYHERNLYAKRCGRLEYCAGVL